MKEIAIIGKVVAAQSLMACGNCIGINLEVANGLGNTLEIAVLGLKAHTPYPTQRTIPDGTSKVTHNIG